MRGFSHRVSRNRSRRAPREQARAGVEVLPPADELRHVPTVTALAVPSGLPGPGEPDESGLLITRQRAGLYVVSDASGQVVGRISGDYVVGFTATYHGASDLFGDLEAAKAAIAELHAAETGGPLEGADA